MLLMAGDELERWAQCAAPGDAVIYARDGLPSGFARQMRPMIDAGILIPNQVKQQGQTNYLARRGSGDFAKIRRDARERKARRNKNRGQFRKKKSRRSTEGMILRMLRFAAVQSKPCPTNKELARACGLSDHVSASYRMRRLVAMGKIAVEDHSPFGRRVVTILTGKCAGMQTAPAKISVSV